MRIAVIPARGGSKRIPRKNIKDFAGKPMIAWSITSALDSGCFDEVVVSTDDSEIATIAQQYGAAVPFLRPAALSDDYAGTLPVMRHAVDWMIGENWEAEFVCCIYATAPFLGASDIQRGLRAIAEQRADYAFSVTTYAYPVQRALFIDQAGRVRMFHPAEFSTRSQDLPEAFHDAGQFYWGTTDAWRAERPIFTGDAVPVLLPRHRVQDIDTPEDWVSAEWLFRALQEKSSQREC